MPKVSVIVPVYNVEQYLRKCLDTLVNQTLKEIEIIIVNDGTKDNSQSIIDEYKKKDNRIKSYVKDNGGLSSARNYGMQYAEGEFLAFVDSDDYVELNMFEKMYDKAIKEDCDLVECDFIWEYPDRKRTDKSQLDNNRLISMRVVAWNKIYRRSLIEKLNLAFPLGLRYEDVGFCYKLLPFVKNIGYVDANLYHYVQRSNSIANTQNEKVRDIYTELQLVLDYYKEKGIYDEYKKQLEYIYMRYILSSSLMRVIKIKDKEVRKKILEEGYQHLKTNFPNWRKNEYIKTSNKLKKIYYKSVNSVSYYIYAFVFRMVSFDRWIS